MLVSISVLKIGAGVYPFSEDIPQQLMSTYSLAPVLQALRARVLLQVLQLLQLLQLLPSRVPAQVLQALQALRVLRPFQLLPSRVLALIECSPSM
jgi:hypothetical protein